MAALWIQVAAMVIAVTAFTRMKLVRWRREADKEEGNDNNNEGFRRLDGFERVFDCFKVRAVNRVWIMISRKNKLVIRVNIS